MIIFDIFQQTTFLSFRINCLTWDGRSSGGHLAQPPAQNWIRLLIWLHIRASPRVDIALIFLGNLLQCLSTFTVKSFFLCAIRIFFPAASGCLLSSSCGALLRNIHLASLWLPIRCLETAARTASLLQAQQTHLIFLNTTRLFPNHLCSLLSDLLQFVKISIVSEAPDGTRYSRCSFKSANRRVLPHPLTCCPWFC